LDSPSIVIADSPRAHCADRVDQQTDRMSRRQQRQAESIHRKKARRN